MITATSPFALTISLNVLEHLGINLYSNVPAVLSEIVANSWDADATEVRIDWDRTNDRIVIYDDGCGMTKDEINERFLKVGYRRRDDQPGTTARGRRPMGRKGIGKLSLFSIAGVVQIETVKIGEKSAFCMRLDDIRQQIEQAGGEATYVPEAVGVDAIEFAQGTRITLTDLRKRQTIRTTQALKRRLARRFSIIGASNDFSIFVDGEEVTPADRDYYDKVQYLWTYGSQDEIVDLCINAEQFDRSQILNGAAIQMSGWLGTVSEVRYLKDEDGDNLNRIAIFVRGKMAQEDILSDFSERGVYASYLIGDLRVDALDTYDGQGTEHDEDAATSSRQRIVEDDWRYQDLKKIVGTELKYIQNAWSQLRAEEGANRALEIPAVKEWMESLKPKTRAKARKWLGKINRIRLDDLSEQKQLIKHAVLAFEFYRVNENLEALERIDDEKLQAALEIFEELDGLEANLYGQIVQQRVRVIRTLEEKVDENAREKAIQQYLFDHLWLLDPAWERAEGTEVMERPVKALFDEIDAGLSDEERKGRLDIGYRKTAGQHVIIEMKRPERVVTTPELIEQIDKYLTGMQRILVAQGTPNESIEFILLLGMPPREWNTDAGKDRSINALSDYRARVVFYEELLRNARQAYQDYLEKRVLVDKLDEVIKAIEDYAPPSSS
jgi:hypothetical protein